MAGAIAGNMYIGCEILKELREEGRLKPIKQFVANGNTVDLTLTANGSYLVSVEK